jgi:hypothetical protein
VGYVAAFRKGSEFPPAAIVITETLVDVLLFPFVKDSHPLLTAAHLSFNLWGKNVPTLVEGNSLRLLACLFYAGFKYEIDYAAAEAHEEMRKIMAISTDNDSKDEEIKRITAAYEAEKEEIEKEIKEFKRILAATKK